jgi:hypothetical protein
VGALLAHLDHWQTARRPGDCPLPELWRCCQQEKSALTIGQFHDGLRRLHEAGKIYLHPWTGPLYEIPEPACALLIGHEIAFYASLRHSPETVSLGADCPGFSLENEVRP